MRNAIGIDPDSKGFICVALKLSETKVTTRGVLFVQHGNGRRLSPRAVGDIVERATVKSGVGRRVSQHTFRHTTATHLLRSHANLRHIRAILGHTSLRSTQVCTHKNIEDLKEVMRRSHPHGKRTGSVKL
jgi:integrase/recombinase XerD